MESQDNRRKFLEELVDSYHLQGEPRRIFLMRFVHKTHEPQHKTDDQFAKDINLHVTTVRCHMEEIYEAFAKSPQKPYGCDIDPTRRGRGKFEKLSAWLWGEQSRLWMNDNPKWREQLPNPQARDVDDYPFPTDVNPIPDFNLPFYVERVPHEAQCYEAILQPGALIRIKASQQMGKTLLLDRILTQARKKNYQTVTVSFELPNIAVFNDMHTFSQRFCALVSKQLGLPNKLADYWSDDSFCSNDNTTDYFEDYLLAEFTNPMILALDKVDRVFEHPAIANDFCSLLRGWYDMARRSDRRSAIWKKLRLIVVHSTNGYGELDINRSPLAGVGLPIRLLNFNSEQVQDLARRHGLNWVSNQEVEQLMAMIGGHPCLVQLAFDYLKSQEVTLENLLQIAPTEAGPFSEHLREHLRNLKRYPEIKAAFREVVMTNQPVKLESDAMFKLDSMGLIQIQKDGYCTVKYNLYRQYFSTRLTET